MIYGAYGYIGSLLRDRILDYNRNVIYLAFMSNNDMCERNPALAVRLNVSHFADELERARGRRFIFASSVAAYGTGEDFTEDSTLNPTTLYGKQKAQCEAMLRESGLDYTIVRCASVCGLSPKMRYDLMVNRMVRDAAKQYRITVNGGTQKRSHVHINDVCRFYAWLLENPQPGQTFNLVAENMSVIDTATLVAKTIGKTAIEVKPATDDRSYTISGKKLEAAGFKCQHSIEEAVVSVYLEQLYG